MSFAEVRTDTVNAKNGPKSWEAGMLVMKSPGILVWKCSFKMGKPFWVASAPRIFPCVRTVSYTHLTLPTICSV